jgi:hypothetical protein
MEIAKTIFNQLGGPSFAAITGSKTFVSGENYLQMSLAPNVSKSNKLKISLRPDDTYDMEFIKISMCAKNPVTLIHKFEGIYCDGLQDVFEETTGIYCTLMPRS